MVSLSSNMRSFMQEIEELWFFFFPLEGHSDQILSLSKINVKRVFIHVGIGTFAQSSWLWVYYFSLAVTALIDPEGQNEEASLLMWALGLGMWIFYVFKEKDKCQESWVKKVSLILNFPQWRIISFLAAQIKRANIAILPTQNILFNACCLRKSKGCHIPSHTDSFHFVPFLMGKKLYRQLWWLDKNLTPWMVYPPPHAWSERTFLLNLHGNWDVDIFVGELFCTPYLGSQWILFFLKY